MAGLRSEDTCPVCLKEFGNSRIGKLPCGHIFCSVCIEEWSKNMNTCPVDRKKFYCIKLYLQLNGKCIREVVVKEKDIVDLFAEDDNIVCQICQLMNREDLLLLCDGCDRGFHTYCLDTPLDDVPEGSWYCARCLPIVTSVESLSDNNHYHSNSDVDDSSDGNIVVSSNSAQRRSGRISSDSSNDDDDGDGSNFSADDDPTSSSQIASHDDVSGSVTMTTDSDSAASQQCSGSSGYPVTDSNHDSDISSPQRGFIASRIRIAYSNQPTPSYDCLVTENNHGNRNQSLSEQNICSHDDSIKHRLRNHRNGHQVCMRRNSTGSFMRCVLSVTDSEQSDSECLPPRRSYPSSRSHGHIEMPQIQSDTKTHNKTTPTTARRINKRRRKIRSKKGKNKRRRLRRHPLKRLVTTPTGTTRRARTVATSPRAHATGADTPQSAIRQLAKARCQAASLEEARKMTQNDVIAHQVRSRQQQQGWWDRKVIDCYKSNTKVVCSPLKNAIRRHPLISSSSQKRLNTSHQKQRCEKTSSDIIGDIFVGMDTLYNKDTVILRSGKIMAQPTSKNELI